MDTAERIYQEAKTLPEAQAKEVLDFLDFLDFLEFLKNKFKKAPEVDIKTINDVSLPGFGMWAERDDMQDSAAYVREMRTPRYKL